MNVKRAGGSASEQRGRRALLKLMGAGAATFPFFRLLHGPRAQAGDAPPLRFVAFCNAQGTIHDAFRPRSPSALSTPGSGTETDFTFDFENSILAPFQPLLKKTLVLDGLDYRCQYESAGPKHHRGFPPFLTGWGTPNIGDGFSPATGPSLDQYLAATFGGTTRFRSLQLATSYPDPIAYVLSYDRTNQPLPPLGNPFETFQTLFASVMPDPMAASALAAAVTRQQSTLDRVASDLGRLSARLGSAERAKLDQHLQAVRDIERTFTAPILASCTKPSPPSIMCGTSSCPTTGPLIDHTDDVINAEDTIRDVTLDLLAQAVACDLTRFATFQLTGPAGGGPMPYASPLLASDKLVGGDLHQTLHNFTSLAVVEQTRLVHAYFAKKVARFCAALDAIPEGNGTVLDHTIVLWGNEHGVAGDHRFVNVPMVLVGGTSVLRTGRYLTFSRDDFSATAFEPRPADYASLTAHNHLLVSLLNAFGLSDQTFGWQGVSGPLPGLV